MDVIPVRLDPDEDLKKSLQRIAVKEGLTAAWVMTCVGSLSRIALRLAEMHTADGEFEIISAAGTISPTGVHVHLAVADPQGTLIGGHLMNGCVVAEHGTVELVLGADPGWRFSRERDPVTGFDELAISRHFSEHHAE